MLALREATLVYLALLVHAMVFVLSTWAITAVAEAPRGAHPSYAHSYYDRDNDFYKAWDPIARDRETFRSWMEEHVLWSTAPTR